MSAAWKMLEKRVAKALRGERNSRGADFGQSMPDVRHDRFAIEVKLRKKLPSLLRLGLAQAAQYSVSGGKVPLLVIKQKFSRDAYVTLSLDDFVALVHPLIADAEE